MGRIRSSASEAKQAASGQAYAIDPDVEQLLSNWGQWAGVRAGLRRQACGVFALAGKGVRGGVAAVAPTVDVDAAWRAEKTVCNVEFSPRFRALLTAHYVHGQEMRRTCRELGLHWQAYEHEVWRAACFFWTRYQRAVADAA